MRPVGYTDASKCCGLPRVGHVTRAGNVTWTVSWPACSLPFQGRLLAIVMTGATVEIMPGRRKIIPGSGEPIRLPH